MFCLYGWKSKVVKFNCIILLLKMVFWKHVNAYDRFADVANEFIKLFVVAFLHMCMCMYFHMDMHVYMCIFMCVVFVCVYVALYLFAVFKCNIAKRKWVLECLAILLV